MMTNRVDRQFREQKRTVSTQAREQRRSVTSRAQELREETRRSAEEAKEKLRRQRSGLEREVQVAKGTARGEEALEQRKRDLPITKPVDTGAKERLAEIARQEKEAKGEIAGVEKEVVEAEAKGVEAITEAEAKAKSEIAEAEAQALGELAKAQSEFEAENVRLGTGDYINRAEFNQLPTETQRKLNELGVEGYNSWLTAQQSALDKYKSDDGYDVAGYLRDNPSTDTGNLTAIGFSQEDLNSALAQNKDLAAFEVDLKASNPALFQVYQEGGIEGYNTEVERLQNIASQYAVRSEWVTPATYAKTQDLKKQYEAGQLSKKDYEASVTALQSVQGFDLPQALEKKVPTATLLSLGITQSQIDAVEEAQQVFNQLEIYKTEATPFYFGKDITTKEGVTLSMAPSYDLPRFLRDNPDFDTNKLVAAVGFSQKAVDSAVEYNQQDWVKSNPVDTYYQALLKTDFYEKNIGQTGWGAVQRAEEWFAQHPELIKLRDEANNWKPKVTEPTLSLVSFQEAYLEARGIDKNSPEAKTGAWGDASLQVYNQLYGFGEVVTSTGIEATSFLFSPARALYPEVEIKDITPLEWAVGVAQVALLAIPVVGLTGRAAARGIITALEIGAGTTFAVATGIQWADMTPLERGISIAITAAIFAPVGIRGTRALFGKRGSVVAQAESSLNKAWGSLDRVKLKHGLESPQYIKALRNMETAQAKLQTALGNVAQGAGRSVKTAIATAQDAGKAARNMDRALRRLRSTSTSSRNYAKVASNAQRAIEASRTADQRLIAQFSRVKSLSARDLASIQKRARIPGLKKAVTDVNKAQTNLNRAWAEAGKYEVGSRQYIKSLEVVSKAQGQLDEVLANFGSKLKPRAVVSPAAGWEGVISKLEGEIKQLRLEAGRLERAAKRAIFDREVTAMNRQLGELRQNLASKEMQLVEFLKARDSGIPSPVVERYLIRWETKPPTQDELRRIFRQFSRKPAEPIKPQPGVAKPKVQVATIERPVVVEQQLKLIPVVKKVVPKAEPKVQAPRVKGKGYEISIEYEPSYRDRVFGKPDVRAETYVEAIGEPLPGSLVVVAGQTVDVPATERAIKTAIAAIAKAAIKTAEKAKVAGKTQPQIDAAVLAQVNAQTKALTEPQVKAQVKPLTKVLTKLVTQVVPKMGVKIRIKTRPRIPKFPIIVTLPDGSKHTLTPEEIAGSAGWKQGFIYKLLFPPFGANNIVNSRKPIAGIPYFTGAMSAYRSIVKKGGKLPKTIMRDMGIMDIAITTTRSGQPKIAFIPDIQQKTRVTGTHKRRKSKTKHTPEVGLGSMR